MGGREGGGGGKAVLKGRGVISSSLVGRAGVGDSSTREEIAELERGGHTRTTTLQVY